MPHRRRIRGTVASALVILVAGSCLTLASSVANAAARPDFQLPFTCGQSWRLDTWAHAPALDMVREPDQHGTEGARVVAPADGVVVRSFRHDNAGNMIQIDHGEGWFTTYLHLESRAVGEGDEVGQGDTIGRVGRDGPTANDHPHLHFELAVDDDGDGRASWGFEGSERVRPWFDGVEYGQDDGQTWRNVESDNCEASSESTATTTTTTTSTTIATTVSETTTTTVPETTTTTTQSTTTTTAPATTTTVPDDTLPTTGTSSTTVAAVIGAALLASGALVVLIRRFVPR